LLDLPLDAVEEDVLIYFEADIVEFKDGGEVFPGCFVLEGGGSGDLRPEELGETEGR